jgi:hypothetical protein
MLSEVKNIISPDIINFQSYWPEDEESFSFLLTVLVGPKGENVEESFDIVVCTPKWLLSKYDKNETILGADKLIVFEFNMERILARIRKLFDNCSGSDWNDIAIKLSRVGHWEFENYRK